MVRLKVVLKIFVQFNKMKSVCLLHDAYDAEELVKLFFFFFFLAVQIDKIKVIVCKKDWKKKTFSASN